MLLIRDVVEENSRTAEVGDVQIGWYPDSPYNAELAAGYRFTATAEAGKKSSVDILRTISDAYLYSKENRLTVIATYGHGKTHLALALANFFGKPYGSPEVTNLLKDVHHAAEKLYGGLRSFKEDNPPFLVVRLQGNGAESLHRMFLNALDCALKEAEPYVGTVSLPFWFAEATAFLEKLTDEQRARADIFLEPHRHDSASLLAAVRDHDGTVYELCRDLSYQLHGVRGDFGSAVSLDIVIKWVTDTYCGREKPLRGLLVLFDEFAVFVGKYAEQRVGSNTGALQQLLDGIANARNAACLVAFSQMDLPDLVKRLFSGNVAPTAEEQDLTKELTRLPNDSRFLLHSSLERVLDTYLKQVPERLADIVEETGDAFQDASDLTVQLLPQRYDYKQGWGTEEVYTVLAEGCFPLHPLTTGLLCTLQLQQGTVTRSVLGAVREALNARRDQPVILGTGVPNWIHPVLLVDWFGDMISDEGLYGQYRSATQAVGGDASPAEKDALKAILLQITANLVPLTHAPGGFARLVSMLTGHPESECAAALQSLADRYLIDKDPTRELYRFPQGGEGQQARKLLTAVKARAQTVSLTTTTINDHLQKSKRLDMQTADALDAGNPGDYAAKEWLLTASSFTAQKLREQVARQFKVGPRGFEKGERGGIVYLLAKNDDEVTQFQADAQRILDAAFPASEGVSVPVVLGVPTAPHPGLIQRIRNELAFQAMEANADLREYGPTASQKVRDNLKAELEADLKSLRADVQWTVPSLFAAEVNRVAARNDWKVKLDCCYRMAYADMPPAFKKQYAAGATNLRKAVAQVAQPLAMARLQKEKDAIRNANSMAGDIITSYLSSNGQASSWGLVDLSGAPLIPTKSRLRKAWEHLDTAFAPRVDPALVRDALLPLLNPPFGYDWNHVTLLFCAWVGYHANRIKFQEKNSPKSLHDFLSLLPKPEDFVVGLCERDVSILQLDEEHEAKRISLMIEQMKTARLSSTEARNRRTELNAFAQNPAMNDAARDQAKKASEDLDDGLKRSEEHEATVRGILRVLQTSAGIGEILDHLKVIEEGRLPKLTFVSAPDVPDAATLRAKVRTHLLAQIQRESLRCGTLKQLDSYRECSDGLRSARDYAIQIGESTLKYEIDAKITALEERKRELEADQHDRFLVEYLQSLHPASLPIVELVEIERELRGREARGDRARESLEKRAADVQKTLAEARDFLAKMPEVLDSLTSHRQILDQQRRLDQRQFRFVGSEEEPAFQELEARLCQLSVAFGLLEKTNVRSLTTPKEMDQRDEELLAALENGNKALSDDQRAAFTRNIQALDERRQSEGEKAIHWLEKHEAKPPRDITALDDPQPFLSLDGKKRLKALRVQLQEEIQKRVDKDETEAILSRFGKLSPYKQQECLDLLKALLLKGQEGAP